MNEPIAIIGMGCRFPKAENVAAFWRLLVEGVDAVTEIPPSRFDLERYFDERPATPGKVMSRWGGYLDRIEDFDAAFFGIAPREADWLDPQQRLLLEVSWEALEDAGQDMARVAGSSTGVFVGMWLSDYEARLFHNPDKVDFYMTTGSGRYAASGRISYVLGLQGPSLTIDTACSSSLVAVHLACQSLRAGECQMALATASNVILQPHITIAYSQSRMMAPDGHCKFGDSRANGYVRSEGAAAIALKTLKQALADGDPIYAVIRGSAVNNDGHSGDYLATPAQAGQEDMLRKAYASAGVSPGRVSYVEAHGTGTRAGDPIELGALGVVLAEGRPAGSKCVVGSVKTNIGHTEGAAGLAGLIKTVLSLQQRTLPATLHFQEPSPNIPWAEIPLEIRPQISHFPDSSEPIIAGVSAFGIAGTNAHIVLEEAPRLHRHEIAQPPESYLLPLSARSREALVDLARRYAAYETAASLYDVAFTASARRTHHEYRLGLVAHTWDDLRERLTAFANGENQRGVAVTPENLLAERKIAFVFSGQGGQWVGMGRGLAAQEPVFRQALEACDAAMQPYTGWSLLAELNAGEAESRLDEIDVIQPVIFAVQVALAALWRSWGVEPHGIIGHSMGEVAAAHVAGILSLDDAAHVICRRSQLMKQVSGQGAMALVELTYAAAEQIITAGGYSDRLGIAVNNGPTSTVLSGDPAALQEVVAQLEAQGVFCRFVKVDVAAHSPHMDRLRPLLVADLKGLQAAPEQVSIFSTVRGEWLSGASFDAAYWGQNLRQPVRFAAGIEAALAEGFNTFIEFSPHPVLLSAIERGYGAQAALLTLPSTRREEDERAVMLESLGALYAAGYNVDWSRLYPQGGETVALPTYPWQKERFWYADDLQADSRRSRRDTGGHPLLGVHLRAHTRTHYWETELELAALDYLSDHRVRGQVVLPAAAYAEIALAAAHEAFGSGLHRLADMTFTEALFLTDEIATMQVIITPESERRANFQVITLQGDSWVQHAQGAIITEAEITVPVIPPPSALQDRLGQLSDSRDHYQAMTGRGLHYGPAFQGIGGFAVLDGEALAALNLPEAVQSESQEYQIHPALLDACFQLLLDTLPSDDTATYLPVAVESLTLLDRPAADETLFAYAVRTENPAENTLQGDVYLQDETGRVLLAAVGLRMTRLATESQLNDWLYQVEWVALPSLSTQPDSSGVWLVMADNPAFGRDLAAALGGAADVVLPADAYAVIEPGIFQVNPAEADDFRHLLSDGRGAYTGVIFAWGLTVDAVPDLNRLHAFETLTTIGALHLVQALAAGGAQPRLWLLTRQSQPVAAGDAVNITAAPLWGLGAVLANEQAELRVTRLDIDAETPLAAWLPELAAGEDQVAYRAGVRYAARLRPHALETADPGVTRLVSAAEQPFRAEITTPGVLDNLRLRAMTRRAPAPGEVEIEVVATGLNFMNVMAALGVLPGYAGGVGPLGIECAGRIVRVGEGVQEWQPGDEVVAVAFDSLATHAVTDAHLVARKPHAMSFAEAATIPIVYLTAYYALHHLARLSAGERVLIHAAAGGVGLAAIQLAQRAGAEVWATAGTPEKHDLLHSLGVEWVMDSRTLSFAEDILAATNGEGVDVVLNSLAGEAIARGLALLRPYGRFVEIGKRDIYQNTQLGLLPFQKNLAYFAVDLDKMSRERPALVGEMLREIMRLVEGGELRPIPLTVFPAGDVVEAFRFMAQGKHTGKIIITYDAPEVPVFIPADAGIRPDASYLITGGLGGLGLAVARWLAEQGASQLVLVGRSAPSESAQAAIGELEAAGVAVLTAQADMADPEAVASLISHIQETMLPLKGVVHAAGVLADATLLQMDAARFRAAMRPKLDGAWNLHEQTRDYPLDFFVMFSSVAALLGIPGQANYAAGNAFMDALAHDRRSAGQSALSINWGPWSEVGLAAAQTIRGNRLAQRGLGSLSPDEGIAVFEQIMMQDQAQIAVMRFDAGQWVQTYSTAAGSSLLANLLAADVSDSQAATETHAMDIRAQLLAAEIGTPRYGLLETHIREQVGGVLGLAAGRVDVQKPLRNMGLDSLMTLELRNRLEATFKLKLPATLVFNYPTVAALTVHLAEKMDIPLTAAKAPVAQPDEAAPVDNSLEGLTQDEIQAMLAEELSSLDDLLKGI